MGKKKNPEALPPPRLPSYLFMNVGLSPRLRGVARALRRYRISGRSVVIVTSDGVLVSSKQSSSTSTSTSSSSSTSSSVLS